MQWSDDLEGTGGHMDQVSDDERGLSELAQALPPRLAELLARLAYLTQPGQELVLETVGPGSRLVLEALRLVDRGHPASLTEMGQQLSEYLADNRQVGTVSIAGIGRLGPRIRRIARVTPIHERGLAAASTAVADDDTDSRHYAVYDLQPEPDDRNPGSTGAIITVARDGRDVLLWQQGGSDTVIVVESMEALPRSGRPSVLPNPDDEAPSVLVRRRLGLSNENNG
jgi:hypothetical protein